MKASCKQTASILIRAVGVGILVLALGCAGANKATKDSAADAGTDTRPGVAAWNGHALELPREAPIVISAQLDRLLMSAQGMWDWLVAQPEMFGEDGESFVGFLRTHRRELVARIGSDPLTPTAWIDIGVDVTRGIHIGMYPAVDSDSDELLSIVEEAIREELGIDESTDVRVALEASRVLGGEEPLRLYGDVTNSIRGLDPLTGFRAVVPLADRDVFEDNVDRLLSGIGLQRLEPPSDLDADDAAVYAAEDVGRGAILVRYGPDEALFDYLEDSSTAQSTSVDVDEHGEHVRERLERVVDEVPSGRPAAPGPVGEPILSVSVDQEGAAAHALIRGFLRSITRARSASLGERESSFTTGLLQSYDSAANFEVVSRQLTGLVYGLFVGESDRLVRLGIDLFGARPDKPLSVSESALDLALDKRGLATSVDLVPMNDPTWQSWIGVDSPVQIVDHFGAMDAAPTLFALSFPRSVAILFTNADKLFRNRIPNWAMPLFEQRESLGRLEVGSAGIDVKALRLQPKAVGVLSLREGVDDDAFQRVRKAMQDAVILLDQQIDSPDDSEAGILPDLEERMSSSGNSKPDDTDSSGENSGEDGGKTPDEASSDSKSKTSDAPDSSENDDVPRLVDDELDSLALDGVEGKIHYFLQTQNDMRYLYFTYGLERAQAKRELEAARKRKSKATSHIVRFRAEPVALFSILTLYDPQLFEPLDVNILSQRIGAMSVEVRPARSDDVQHIRYDFVVGTPPKLQE